MRKTIVASLLGTITVIAARPASALAPDVVPHSIDLDQRIRLSNGQVHTKREILQQIPPNQPIQLRSGKTITWQHMLEVMKLLEDQTRTPLATMPRTMPLRPQTAAIVARQQQAQAAEITQLRELERTHWASIISRKYQFAPQFGSAPPRGGPHHPRRNPSGDPGAPTCGGTPDRSPDDAPWNTTLGDPQTVSATLSFDFADKGDKHSASCQASLDASASILNIPIDMAKAALTGTASPQSVDGEVDVYLFGAQVWSKSGTVGSKKDPLTPSWSLPWNSPKAQIPVFAGVVSLEASASVGLSAGLKIADVPSKQKTPDTTASCAAQFGPNADAKATGVVDVTIDPPQAIAEFLSKIGVHINDLMTAGLEGTIDAANIGIPTTGQIGLGPWTSRNDRACAHACRLDPQGDECTHFCAPGACLVLTEELSSKLQATFLSGELDAYVSIANPCVKVFSVGVCLSDLIHDATNADVPVTQDNSHIRWNWTIYSEPGFQYGVTLFDQQDAIALH